MGWSETAATWMSLLSLCLLVVAIMDHNWIFICGNRQNYYSGLWKICTKLNCRAVTYITAQAKSAKVLLMLALFCGFISLSFMILTYRFFTRYAMYRYLVSAMGSFLTASLLFLGLAIYTIRLTMNKTKAIRITYMTAFYLGWSSCLCFILSGILGLMAHSHSPLQRISYSDSESMSLSSISRSESTIIAEEEAKPKPSMIPSEENSHGTLHV